MPSRSRNVVGALCVWAFFVTLLGQSAALQRKRAVSRANPAITRAPSSPRAVTKEGRSTRWSQMRSTKEGICMYELPTKFNLDLRNSTFGKAEPSPQPLLLSRPPMAGLHDTNQFSLERIFYERMQLTANELRAPYACRLFYIPYFVAWETSDVDGVWNWVKRPKLEEELLTLLPHYFRNPLKPGADHFVVIGRVLKDVTHFLNNPSFRHLIKLIIEDTLPGRYENVHAIPYPTWFRYSPDLEPAAGEPGVVKILTASHGANCDPAQTGNLLGRLANVCNQRAFCGIHVGPDMLLSNVDFVPACKKEHDLRVQYSCGTGRTFDITTTPGNEAWSRSLAIGCGRGPCWLRSACAAPDPSNASGPLVAFIGSTRGADWEPARSAVMAMCRKRMLDCVLFDTGIRAYSASTTFFSRVPEMYEVLLTSTFCLNPPGDTPTRKGLFDSLVLGCIPVVTSEKSLQHYKWHIPNWQEVSVYVPEEVVLSANFNIVDHLKEFVRSRPGDVRRMQQAIQRIAYSLQYSASPAPDPRRGPDAFGVAAERLLALADAGKA